MKPIILSNQERDKFLELLEKPSKANKHLCNLFEKYGAIPTSSTITSEPDKSEA